MTDHEKYLFDLQGYLVVPDALGPACLDALNALFDARIAAEGASESRTHRFLHLLDWGKPYRDLIDAEPVASYLSELLGASFRLDHEYADLIRAGKGPIGTTLHGGAFPFDPTFYYRFDGERMRCGLIAVAYNLKDVNPGDGGFGAVPGSHKSNLRLPDEWRELDDAHPRVDRVVGPAGTAILFTEAMTHGTLPWSGAGERRTLFYKYSPHSLSWAASYYDPYRWDDLTERQRAILEAPNARYGGRAQRPYGG